MPRYIVEREVPHAGELSEGQLDTLCQRLEEAIVHAQTDVEWVQSFVSNDKIYCMYVASDEEVIRRISDECGFPTTRISQINATLVPASEEEG